MAVLGPVTGRLGVDGVADGVGVPSPPPPPPVLLLGLGLGLGGGGGCSQVLPPNWPGTSRWSWTWPFRSFHTTWTMIVAGVPDATPVCVMVAWPPLGRLPVPFSMVLPLGEWSVTSYVAAECSSWLVSVHVTVTLPVWVLQSPLPLASADQANAGPAANTAATAVPTTAAPESFRSLRAVGMRGLVRDTGYDRLYEESAYRFTS